MKLTAADVIGLHDHGELEAPETAPYKVTDEELQSDMNFGLKIMW
jgi:hypothetical protein